MFIEHIHNEIYYVCIMHTMYAYMNNKLSLIIFHPNNVGKFYLFIIHWDLGMNKNKNVHSKKISKITLRSQFKNF